MKISNVVVSDNRMGFLLEDASCAYANALRRSIVSLVPTLAIEDVEFFANNSALYDETIAHRLGLLPLTTDLSSYELPKSDAVDGVTRSASEVKLYLEANGPCTVYAKDLKCKDPSVKCAYPQMPIVKLLKNQSLKLEATAVLGQAKVHAKWSPAHAFYVNQYVIEDGKTKVSVIPKDLMDAKQQELFSENGKLNMAIGKTKEGTVTQKTDSMLFFVESFGQLQAKEIVSVALDQLIQQLDLTSEALKAI
jgi:DNA-directed RNA polymerase subunit D